MCHMKWLQIEQKEEGFQDLVSSKSPEELTKAAKKIEKSIHQGDVDCLSINDALGLFFDLNLSKEKYNTLRSVVNRIHKDCFPSYYALKIGKDEMLPNPITVSETSAEVPLQDLVNRTVSSLVHLSTFKEKCNEEIGLTLECKWGFDGSSGHSQYKQKFTEEPNSDEFLIVCAIVPLRIVNNTSGKEVWLNSQCSSSRYCRPIKICFKKECPQLVRELENNMQKEISELRTYQPTVGEKKACVDFKFMLTMMDGAIINVLTGNTAGQTCYLCHAKPIEMNTLNIREKPVNKEFFKYGLSTLHAHIKFFECILHISYRLPLKCWRVTGERNKQTFNENKKRVQHEFKLKTGLIIDGVKTGYGTTNDGNTARRFFENCEISAEITKIDVNLIKNFDKILRIISCAKHINFTEFEALLDKTFHLYLNLYSWYYMPSTVHKILVHGSQVSKSFEISIGLLSEEAIETQHKEIRKMRLNNARKVSTIATNYDIMSNMLLSSDPLLVRKRKSVKFNSFENIKEYVVQDDKGEANSGSEVSDDELI
ncbi:uncharacterized protein LOC118749386 [Rhagoletis pomonella]|uniref:uncharacterized protein LOC118749386 n=1 Tax=Rhagoletis pomonella TaxID=28610 RepID=UPI0017828693|nr:uncharacterized protein LOC118749386 [Rhagoletis pomonella]